MSLTRLLSSSTIPELKNALKEYFPRPQFSLSGDMLAIPQSKNYAIVGAAFDYLLRFHLERLNGVKVVKQSWVAVYALNRLEVRANLWESSSISGTGRLKEYFRHRGKCDENIYRLAKEKFDVVLQIYNQFLQDGQLNDELIESTIFLAKLDVLVRAGLIDDTLMECTKEDIDDLRNLISIVPFSEFIANKKCYLNPDFGNGSLLVGGADADLIIDDTLYDIKVTKHLRLNRDDLNQIICYYVLSQLGGVNGKKTNKPIKNIGIYFARHSKILKFRLTDFNTTKNIKEFIKWFPEYMDLRFSQKLGE